MRRRAFITLLGGAVAARSMIGFLSIRSSDTDAQFGGQALGTLSRLY
jgi:hypothetical protein